MARTAALLAAALVLAACGGTTTAAPTTTAGACHGPAQKRALARLHRGLAALKAAGKIPVKNSLLGGPAANHATDRFLHDVATSPISNLMRNRLIDYAARDVAAYCEQCFQALEAERPVPSIAHEGTGANC
jgi:hypothetical protein